MSDTESVRYDRQIRLWGKTAQRRLMASHLYCTTIRGVAGELSKNLVLAGVHAVTVADPASVHTWDLENNLLFQNGRPGDSCASVGTVTLQALNPHVLVEAADVPSSPGKGETHVLYVEAQHAADVPPVLARAPWADIVVINCLCGGTTLSFFLYRASPQSLEAQWHELTMNPSRVREKPAAYQRALLRLLVRRDGSQSSSPRLLLAATELAETMQMHELTPADVEEVVQHHGESCSAVLCTLAGASVAQLLTRLIGDGAGAEAFQWMTNSVSPMGCSVGFA